MSDRWLPEIGRDYGSFKPEVAKPLVQRGLQRLLERTSKPVFLSDLEVFDGSLFLWTDQHQDDYQFSLFEFDLSGMFKRVIRLPLSIPGTTVSFDGGTIYSSGLWVRRDAIVIRKTYECGGRTHDLFFRFARNGELHSILLIGPTAEIPVTLLQPSKVVRLATDFDQILGASDDGLWFCPLVERLAPTGNDKYVPAIRRLRTHWPDYSRFHVVQHRSVLPGRVILAVELLREKAEHASIQCDPKSLWVGSNEGGNWIMERWNSKGHLLESVLLNHAFHETNARSRIPAGWKAWMEDIVLLDYELLDEEWKASLITRSTHGRSEAGSIKISATVRDIEAFAWPHWDPLLRDGRLYTLVHDVENGSHVFIHNLREGSLEQVELRVPASIAATL